MKDTQSIALAAAWILISEFVRNQLLFLHYWTDHYKSLGLKFSSNPVHGMVWMIWSIVFAAVLYVLCQKFSFKETFWLGWILGFVMMWLVIGNLGVLPYGLLFFAVPLSMLEVFIALKILRAKHKKPKA